MPIITVGNEKNLDQLIGKHFSGLSATEAKRAREATLKANPHLRAAAGLKPGTVVVLPQATVPAVKPAAGRDAAQSDTVERLAEALKIYTPQLKRALEEAQTELDQSAKVLKSAAFKKALDGAGKEAANLAKDLGSELKREIETNGEARASLSGEIDVLLKDLGGLAKKLA